ncbi:MAG: HAMP domain-containing protein [Chloroflexi bacterium]|nr:HAMP domain-containing protein [Chloroflexota bacterium]
MFRDLRTQLLLWIILPLAILLIGVSFFSVNSHQNAMRDMVLERDGTVARATAAQWSDNLTSHARILPTLDPAQPPMCDTSCAAFDGGIATFDSNGNLLSALPSTDAWKNRQALVTLLLSSHDTFSPPFAENGVIRILVAAPSPHDRNLLVGAFTPPSFAELGFGHHGVAYLVDKTGKIIAHPDSTRIGENMSAHEGIAEVIRGEAGATFHHTADGAELVVGYAPIAPPGWGLIIEEPWAEVVAPMFQYSTLLPLVLLFAAILALGAIYFGVRNIVRPLQQLAQAANRIAYGDYGAAEQRVGGIREVEELRETLDSMAHQVQSAQTAMQNYISTIMRGQEDERVRLAHELHDDTIQSLIALQQRIEMAQKAFAKDPALANAKMDELKHMLTETLVSVRRFVRDLRPTYLQDLGLIPALEMLARESHAEFKVEGTEVRLDAERELALFRIVQEALRNVSKHARATQLAVTLSFDTDTATASIEDNGVGFDAPDTPTAYAQSGHFGLTGMQERAQLFGGNVYIKSERGKGTRVIVYVPVKN